MSAPKHTAALDTLDTSGAVGEMPGWRTPVPTCNRFLRWPDLSPFTQGYIEALFEELQAAVDAKRYGLWQRSAFRDLAPETLARIIADCEGHGGATAEDGRRFWGLRQLGDWGAAFPPLTVQLGDDGKVRFQ